MTPSGYEDGKLFSELPTDGSGDFTFSRGSNLAATRVGPTGLIEKGRENLLLQSNQFDTTWTAVGTTLTSGQSGYDGTNDAWLLSKDSGQYRRIIQNISFSGVYTLSVYAKANTLSQIILRDGTSSTSVRFDLSDGSLISSTGAIAYSIVSVGNGWYRCSVTMLNSVQAQIYVDWSQSNAGSIYIQDAQLEVGLAATDYIESGASTGKAGLLENEPRLDYSGGATCPSLLLEPQRSNLYPNSEYFEGWTKNNAVTTINASTSPEGLQNAIKLSGSAVNGQHTLYYIYTGTITNYSHSAFYKAGEYSYAYMRAGGVTGDPYVIYDLTDQSVIGSAACTHDIEFVGNDWYRITLTPDNTSGVHATNLMFLPSSGYTLNGQNIPSFTGDGTSGGYIYGAQLEAGSYPTSYIPTHGSSVTRSVDTFKVTGISDLIDTQGGVMLLETKALDRNQGYSGVSLSDDTFTNNAQIRYGSATDQVQIQYRVGSSNECLASNSENNITNNLKIAFKYESNSFKMFVNGVLKGTDTSGLVNAANTFDTIKSDRGDGNDKYLGRIKQLVVFPTALTDSECIKLTTI